MLIRHDTTRKLTNYEIGWVSGLTRDEIVLTCGSEIGALLVDGLGDGVLLDCPTEDLDFIRTMSFGLLQVCSCHDVLSHRGDVALHTSIKAHSCSCSSPCMCALCPSKHISLLNVHCFRQLMQMVC